MAARGAALWCMWNLTKRCNEVNHDLRHSLWESKTIGWQSLLLHHKNAASHVWLSVHHLCTMGVWWFAHIVKWYGANYKAIIWGRGGSFIFLKCRWSEIRKWRWSLASVTLCKFAHYVRRGREGLNQKEQFESFLFPNKSSSHGLFENSISQISHCKPSSSGRGGTRKNWKKISFENKSSSCQSYSCLKTLFTNITFHVQQRLNQLEQFLQYIVALPWRCTETTHFSWHKPWMKFLIKIGTSSLPLASFSQTFRSSSHALCCSIFCGAS